MKSIEIIVPRALIKEFHPHPDCDEPFCHVVTLMNGMHTDVWYANDGDYVTTTNDLKLISYLKAEIVVPVQYLYRNGVFAFREINKADYDLLSMWNSKEAKVFEIEIPIILDYDKDLIYCFYLIESGLVKLKTMNGMTKIRFEVYKTNYMDSIDIETASEMLKQFLEKA